jgi:hypothetical protein
MSLVDDNEVGPIHHVSAPLSAEQLERDELGTHSRAGERSRPQVAKRGRRYDQNTLIATCGCERDECLPQASLVGKKRDSFPRQQLVHPSERLALVDVKRDVADASILVVGEHCPRDEAPDAVECRSSDCPLNRIIISIAGTGGLGHPVNQVSSGSTSW